MRIDVYAKMGFGDQFLAYTIEQSKQALAVFLPTDFICTS